MVGDAAPRAEAPRRTLRRRHDVHRRRHGRRGALRGRLMRAAPPGDAPPGSHRLFPRGPRPPRSAAAQAGRRRTSACTGCRRRPLLPRRSQGRRGRRLPRDEGGRPVPLARGPLQRRATGSGSTPRTRSPSATSPRFPTASALRERLTALWDYERYECPVREGEPDLLPAQQRTSATGGAVRRRPAEHRATGAARSEHAEQGRHRGGDRDRALARRRRCSRTGVAEAGSDWQEWQVRKVDTGEDLPDRIQWVKFSAAEWTPDGRGFYYARYDAPGPNQLRDINYFQKLYYHRLGAPAVGRPPGLRAQGPEGVGLRRHGLRRRPLAGHHRLAGQRTGGTGSTSRI